MNARVGVLPNKADIFFIDRTQVRLYRMVEQSIQFDVLPKPYINTIAMTALEYYKHYVTNSYGVRYMNTEPTSSMVESFSIMAEATTLTLSKAAGTDAHTNLHAIVTPSGSSYATIQYSLVSPVPSELAPYVSVDNQGFFVFTTAEALAVGTTGTVQVKAFITNYNGTVVECDAPVSIQINVIA